MWCLLWILFAPPGSYSRASYPVITDSGARLESLFDGSAISSTADRRVSSGTMTDCDRQSASLANRFLKLFQLPSVYAIDCGEGTDCAGAWAQYWRAWCGADCSNAPYNEIVGGGEYPWRGWRLTGNKICPAGDGSGGCMCEEITCVL
jgi:hypothetical protein